MNECRLARAKVCSASYSSKVLTGWNPRRTASLSERVLAVWVTRITERG